MPVSIDLSRREPTHRLILSSERTKRGTLRIGYLRKQSALQRIQTRAAG